MKIRKQTFNIYCIAAALIVLFIGALIPGVLEAVEGRREVLPNGLRVIVSERHNLPIVKLEMIVAASKLDESAAKAGLSHLVAEMLLEGTKGHSSKEIIEEIEFMGASLEVNSEADYTSIRLSALKKDFNRAFEIFADCMLHPAFSDTELTQKKELILGALRQNEDSPHFVANKAFMSEVFGNSPYGRLSTGTPETINAIKRPDIVKFHQEHYVPSNSIIAVAGDITYDEIAALITKHMGNWKGKPIKERGKIKAENYHNKKKITVIDRDITQSNIILGGAGIKRDNPDYYAIDVMNYILGGGGFASRMVKTIRDDMGLAYDVHSHSFAYKYGGFFMVSIQTKNEYANTAITEILKQIKTMKETPVTDDELNDAKSYLTGSFPRRLDTTDKLVTFMALTEFYALGLDYDKRYISFINNITKEDVKRVALKYLTDTNYQLVIVGSKSKINAAQDVK
ncbi:M16 family metallopeptidase [Candidatus Magnetomonas plexicatena]|uniref:M16 family metallopeptidase n=1 Tax=Candidatus Magnetomonas plexicatena TaxID=2552947 RepID=UPI001C78DFE4|nr:insulinase family protein [Nitrospirales bacterium LBB_01]